MIEVPERVRLDRSSMGFRLRIEGVTDVQVPVHVIAELARRVSAVKFDSDVQASALDNMPFAVTLRMQYDDFDPYGSQSTPHYADVFLCETSDNADRLLLHLKSELIQSATSEPECAQLTALFNFDRPPYPEDGFDLNRPENRRTVDPDDKSNRARRTLLCLLRANYVHLTRREFWDALRRREPQFFADVEAASESL